MKKEFVFKRRYKYHRALFFDITQFPMDVGRLICSELQLLYRLRKRGVDGKKYRYQPKGGCLIAANHTSFQDPFKIGICYWRRRCHFMTAEVVMRNWAICFFLGGMGCIRIDRTIADYEAMQQAEACLKTGHVLGMFPQGGINRDNEMNEIKSGIVLLAAKTNVPIIPMYIAPRNHWYERATMIVADPILCSDYTKRAMPSMKELDQIAQVLYDKMQECRAVFEEGRFEK